MYSVRTHTHHSRETTHPLLFCFMMLTFIFFACRKCISLQNTFQLRLNDQRCVYSPQQHCASEDFQPLTSTLSSGEFHLDAAKAHQWRLIMHNADEQAQIFLLVFTLVTFASLKITYIFQPTLAWFHIAAARNELQIQLASSPKWATVLMFRGFWRTGSSHCIQDCSS